MSEMIPIVLFAMFMAIMSHQHSVYDPINGEYIQKERLFYGIMSVALIMFAGLRTLYNDTSTYMMGYGILTENPEEYQNIDWLKWGQYPAFVFVQGIMIRMGVSTQNFLMLFAIFTIGTNLWFFRKYSCNLWLTILIYISFAGYGFNMAAIKQCTAMSLCMIATDRAINKKYIQFVLFVILASMFHPYAWMYLVTPFLTFRPWSKYTLILLTVFGLIGVGMESLLGTLLNVSDMLGKSYDAQLFMGEGVNPVRLLITATPSIVALLIVRQIREHEERDQYVIVNLTMLNAEIMFVALFGTANYFARLANYFLPFQAVSIPWLLKLFDQRGRRTMTALAVLGYVLHLIYSQSIHESFDAAFQRITLWKYLGNMFQEVLN
jgi:hypothetical protein